MENITPPPWRADILKALHLSRSKAESRYVQLATVNNDGSPAVRTVVFRDFLDSSGTVVMHTDVRSHKVTEIRQQPKAQLCWYFTSTREQFRLEGDMRILSVQMPDWNPNTASQKLREDHWQRLSDSAKAGYFWAAPGSTYCEDRAQRNEEQSANLETNDTSRNISDNFAILLLDVHQVDYLQLKPNPHQRNKFNLIDNRWQQIRVNP